MTAFLGQGRTGSSRRGSLTRARGIAFLGLILVLAVGPACSDRKPTGEWRQFHGDKALTGRSPLAGHMMWPKVLWKQYVGTRQTLIELGPSRNAKQSVDLLSVALDIDRYKDLCSAYGIGGPSYDLDGDGKLKPVMDYWTYKIGKFLRGSPGLQKLDFDSGFGRTDDKARFRLLDRREGKWELVWQGDVVPSMFVPNPIAGDFDGDGALEAAFLPWYDVWVVDVATGKLKYKCRFTPEGSQSGRGYGWLGAFDLDGDGKCELVLLATFENHIEVMGFREGKLQVLWSRLLERGVCNKQTQLRLTPNPVGDCDGDGKLEIVLSLYDGQQWKTEIIEGLTGRAKFTAPNRVLVGLQDVNGDGTSEMMCRSSREAMETTRLSVLGVRSGVLREIWALDEADFETKPVEHLPLNINCSDVLREIVVGRCEDGACPVFATSGAERNGQDVKLSFWQSDARGSISRVSSAVGPNLQVLAIGRNDLAGGALIQAGVSACSETQVVLTNMRPLARISRKAPMPLSPPVAGRLDGTAMSVVVQGGNEQAVAVNPAGAGKGPSVRWVWPGRGMRTGNPLAGDGVMLGGYALADLHGDGKLATIVASRSPKGCARLAAISPCGKELWRHDFDNIPATAPDINVGGITMWFPGHFTDQRREDVLVTVRRSTMSTDETMLLDGRTGKIIWQRTVAGVQGEYRHACGGHWMSVFDYDGDGLDDALCAYIDIFVMDGKTGDILLMKLTSPGGVFGDDIAKWSQFGTPIVGNVLFNNQRGIVYGGSVCVRALLNMHGECIWSHGPIAGVPPECLGDIDGDGKLEILSPGNLTPRGRRVFHCYESATGNLKWPLSVLGWRTTSPVACDIDGDGREECLFGVDKSLLCIGTSDDGKSGQIRWRLNLPDFVGPAAVADLNSSGLPQILVVCEDGYLYCIAGV